MGTVLAQGLWLLAKGGHGAGNVEPDGQELVVADQEGRTLDGQLRASFIPKKCLEEELHQMLINQDFALIYVFSPPATLFVRQMSAGSASQCLDMEVVKYLELAR